MLTDLMEIIGAHRVVLKDELAYYQEEVMRVRDELKRLEETVSALQSRLAVIDRYGSNPAELLRRSDAVGGFYCPHCIIEKDIHVPLNSSPSRTEMICTNCSTVVSLKPMGAAGTGNTTADGPLYSISIR